MFAPRSRAPTRGSGAPLSRGAHQSRAEARRRRAPGERADLCVRRRPSPLRRRRLSEHLGRPAGRPVSLSAVQPASQPAKWVTLKKRAARAQFGAGAAANSWARARPCALRAQAAEAGPRRRCAAQHGHGAGARSRDAGRRAHTHAAGRAPAARGHRAAPLSMTQLQHRGNNNNANNKTSAAAPSRKLEREAGAFA